MNHTYLKAERLRSEEAVRNKTFDFTAKYYAVYHLHSLSETNPELIGQETVSALEELLRDSDFFHRRQGLFLFREAAATLASVVVRSKAETTAGCALSALKNILAESAGYAHRAAAEALGGLPFSVNGPEIEEKTVKKVPLVVWTRFLDENRLKITSDPEFIGRSLVAELGQDNRLLVFKLARTGDSPRSMIREPLWMEHLSSASYSFPLRFDIPSVITVEDKYVFRLKDIPAEPAKNTELHPRGYAIGFIADKDYFTYPNDSEMKDHSADSEFTEVMSRNAWLLGNLASSGIVHSAPIPLFHNRVQVNRRRDHGLYEWFRGGRLDRWLDSCSYPNLGSTGIRDFEHLIAFSGPSRNLYRHIGNHILSLLLVAGSYFRNRDREKVGLDENGMPVDARHLFDKKVLKELIREIFLNYFHGFAGTEFQGEIPVSLSMLTSRMTEEMGVDRHMEEFLRVADQNEMTDREFRSFLSERGYSEEEISGLQKGARDIAVCSGPHLGGFNQRISLPELTESVETMSAMCIAGRFAMSSTR